MRKRTLELTPDHAVIATSRELVICHVRTSKVPRVELELGPVHGMAVFGGSELWVAAGEPPALSRIRLADGARIGSSIPLWGSGAMFATTAGPPGVLWTAPPATLVVPDGDNAPIAGDWDFVLPVSCRQWLTCRRDAVVLRDPNRERWSANVLLGSGRVVDGAVLFDGGSAVLAVAQSGSLAQLIVMNLHNGMVQHRMTLTGIDLVRFAPARGYALCCAGVRLVYLDLRFGRVIKEVVVRAAIVDAAIDRSGQNFVVRHSDLLEDIWFGTVDADAPRDPPSSELVVAHIGIEKPALPPEPTREFHRGHAPLSAFAALAPRAAARHATPTEATTLLDRHRQLISALVVKAITRGWDSGRIGFPGDSPLPFRNEVIGILGELTGRAPVEVATADRRVAQASAALEDAEIALGDRVAPLAALAGELGLSATARSIMLVIAAPSLWGELARLYGILGNDEDRAMVDEALLVEILAGRIGRTEIARELDDDAPLVRYGVVRIGDRQRPFAALSCDPIALRIVRGDGELKFDEIGVVHATCAFDDLLIPAVIKDQIVRALVAAASPARIVVRGRNGSGRHTLLAAIAATAQRSLAVIDVRPFVMQPVSRIGQLWTTLCRAHMLGLLPCIDGLENIAAEDRSGRDLVGRMLNEHPGPLAIRLPWDAQPLLAPGHVAIDLPALTFQQRTVCWHEIIAAHDLLVREPGAVADRFGIGPGAIHRVCAQVAASARTSALEGSAEHGDDSTHLDVAIRQYLELGVRATATRVQRLATWSRVVLPPDVQDSVLELIARIKHRRMVYDLWGYDQVLTTARGVTALFQGGPGTGKTLVASAIASELGMDLYRVDLSRIMSKWIGETEQNLAKLFDAAEDGHSIILFDEADSLFAKRTEVRTSIDRYANLEVNYLLQRLDTFEGIAILTTNFGTSIDSAFKRRLSFRLTFPFPDEEAREALWRAHVAPGVPKSGEFDFAELARRYQVSGGYIRNAAIRGAFLAAGEQTPLTQAHLVRAIQAEFREIGKIAESGVLE